MKAMAEDIISYVGVGASIGGVPHKEQQEGEGGGAPSKKKAESNRAGVRGERGKADSCDKG